MVPTRDTSSSFLSPQNYDDDASSMHSERSDQETDSDDDEVLMGARSSADIRAHDRRVLLEEEERDELLEESRKRGRRGSTIAIAAAPLKKLFSKSFTELPTADGDEAVEGRRSGKRERKKRRRARRRQKKDRLMSDAQHGGDGQLYEMEEGFLKDCSATGDSSGTEGSDEIDRRTLLGLHDGKVHKRQKWRRWCFIHLLITVGFSILVLIAWRLSLNRKGIKANQLILSNGTALFAPTTILISLDGFRADFLNRGITPRLNAFVAEGISPVYMSPSFPSVTFPNHYTLVTGLYPESHGIVGNTFWDTELQEEFFYTNPQAMTPKWWGGEPLWVTAENQGIRTAIHMWPGSEAHIADVEPAFIDKYFGAELLPKKVARILELIDLPGQENELVEVVDMRPQLIAAYVPNVDQDGHLYGPNSTEIRTTINNIDNMLDGLFKGLETRNLTDIVNVVVVSDHGMATVNNLIQLEDIIDTSLIEHMDGWPLYGLRPKDSSHLQQLYDTLKAASLANPNYEVYLRDKDMPERYHFTQNERIAPLWIIPKPGWAIVTKSEFDVAEAKEKGLIYHPRGLHGYDHEHPLMRAIFIARGPAFPHAPNSRMEPFQNIEVYNIVCDSLGLEPKPNNGTLRLPLKPVGTHSSDTMPDDPVDPQSSAPETAAPPAPIPSQPQFLSPEALASQTSISPQPPTSTISDASEPDGIIQISPIEESSAANPDYAPPHLVGVDLPEEPNVDRPVVGDDSTVSEEEKGFWQWLTDKVNEANVWVSNITGHGEAKANDEASKGGQQTH